MSGLGVTLRDAPSTVALGEAMAACLGARPGFALLLDGPLGAGKTTLVRGLVSALPGAERAEVASPSFNICNIYPTRPEVAHVDLYRLEGRPPGEDFENALEVPETLVIVEWAQYLHPPDLPAERVICALAALEGGRTARLSASGREASAFLDRLARVLAEREVPFTFVEGET